MLRGLKVAVVCLWAAVPVQAQDIGLTEDLPSLELVLNGQTVLLQRDQNPEAVLAGDYARTARACPPQCVQPMQAAPGVATQGEREVIAFLQAKVAAGAGAMIDARLPDGFASGSLPGAVNVPFALLAPDNQYRNELLKALGAQVTADGAVDFSTALDLAVYAEGPWSDTAVQALRFLIEAGYPPEKLNYYRGGVQDWLHYGLAVSVAGNG